MRSFLNHLWYLTEELVIFAVYDQNLPTVLRKAIVLQSLSIQRPTIFAPQKPVFPKINPEHIEYPDQLVTLVGPRSWLLFHLLNSREEKLDWMQAPVECWEKMSGYTTVETIVRNFKVTNDSAERNIKLLQDYTTVPKLSQRNNRLIFLYFTYNM